MSEKNCHACKHSYMGPGDDELVCGHPDAGPMGEYARVASEGRVRSGAVLPKLGHCGPERAKFEQHPLRNPDGSLKRMTGADR